MVKRDRTHVAYLEWMDSLVERSGYSFFLLLMVLDSITFKVLLSLDENRADDGLALRERFYIHETFLPENMRSNHPATVAEVLIALAIRMGETLGEEDNIPEFFTELLKNLGLNYPNHVMRKVGQEPKELEIGRKIDIFMGRRYSRKGLLFPLKHPEKDQTRVEIWYQMMSYLEENYPL
jgi:hypothetical protein